ncbi:hypothetical protein M422DRAFT_273187 [Sphaerobolus stellatus SS14]|uniref:SET domain-containing protein n=1 Tax=Sphaerobolus stellatus (strain SS14) TaxID=990650 RepID=A0A0C9UKP0_SPHS4|nr:hypothetical protein M422DRAFT_273187 [Sphaerobolus stellatus SS14]
MQRLSESLESWRDVFIIHHFYDVDRDGTRHTCTGCYAHEHAPRHLMRHLPGFMPFYQIQESNIHGRGLFATKNIRPGELIFAERPLMVLPGDEDLPEGFACYRDDTIEQMCTELIRQFTPEEMESYASLGNVRDHGVSPQLGKFLTNSVSISFRDIRGTATTRYNALFPTLCYTNHSCGPNSGWLFDYKTFAIFLRAGRAIAKGEEITVNYTNDSASRNERIGSLRANYDFTCYCKHCTCADVSSCDKSRQELSQWLDTTSINEWIMSDPILTAQKVLNIFKLITLEGLEYAFAEKPFLAFTVLFGSLGLEEEMIHWGKYVVAMACVSQDFCETMLHWMSDPPITFPYWNRSPFSGDTAVIQAVFEKIQAYYDDKRKADYHDVPKKTVLLRKMMMRLCSV